LLVILGEGSIVCFCIFLSPSGGDDVPETRWTDGCEPTVPSNKLARLTPANRGRAGLETMVWEDRLATNNHADRFVLPSGVLDVACILIPRTIKTGRGWKEPRTWSLFVKRYTGFFGCRYVSRFVDISRLMYHLPRCNSSPLLMRLKDTHLQSDPISAEDVDTTTTKLSMNQMDGGLMGFVP
jgi:hypothetical protein